MNSELAGFLSVIAAGVIHELGHIFSAVLLGIKCRGLSCKMGGALLTFDFSCVSYARESAVHFAGPAAGIITAAMTAAVCPELTAFIGANILLAAVNLIPIRFFDGGALLMCVLRAFTTDWFADRFCRIISAVCGVLFWIAAIWIEINVEADIGLIVFAVCIMIYGASEQ